MHIVSSQKVQAKFGEIADIVKRREPVVITQYGRPTMMLVAYDDGMAMLEQNTREQALDFLSKRAKNAQPMSDEEMAEISRMIEEEREAVYQENLKKNAQ